MRASLLTLCSILISVGSTTARADISKDLKFCSGLQSPKERLACYDAAARIESGAAKSSAHIPLASLKPKPITPAEARTIQQSSSFNGTYVALGSGYDFNVATATSYPNVPLDSLYGPKLGLIVGHNAVSGPLLIGFEGRAQYDFAKSSASHYLGSVNYALPHMTSWMWCGSCDNNYLNNYPFPGNTPVTLTSSTNTTMQIKRPWMADFSVRAGMLFGDLLIYSRLGAGFEQTERTVTNDQSSSSVCNNPIYARSRPGPQEVRIDLTGCGSITGGPITVDKTISYDPIVTLGFGFERNIGPVFIRGEAEMINHLYSGYYTPAANIAAGYRF